MEIICSQRSSEHHPRKFTCIVGKPRQEEASRLLEQQEQGSGKRSLELSQALPGSGEVALEGRGAVSLSGPQFPHLWKMSLAPSPGRDNGRTRHAWQRLGDGDRGFLPSPWWCWSSGSQGQGSAPPSPQLGICTALDLSRTLRQGSNGTALPMGRMFFSRSGEGTLGLEQLLLFQL